MCKAYFNENTGLAEIGRCFTFGCANRRDIVRRLKGTCESFAVMSFADALNTFRTYERDGLVKWADGYVVVYHAA